MTGEPRDSAVEAASRIDLSPPARVGVATSGGPDSLAALVLIAGSCAARQVPVTALFVDHGLRRDSAEREVAIVARAAAAVGAALAIRRVDVPEARRRAGGSIEFVARQLRHGALDEMAAELALTHVVVAHHRDDQVETVLLSVLRGAWPGALAGIPAARAMPCGAILLRPFLSVPRDALRAHAAGFEPASDPMNLDVRHRRVAVRTRLLPALRLSDPDVDGVILEIAAAAAAVDRAASSAAAELLRSSYREPGVFVMPASALTRASAFARARLIRTLCDEDAAFGPPTWSLLEAVTRAASTSAPREEEVRRGIRLTSRGGSVALFADVGLEPREWTWDGSPCSIPVDAVRRLRIEPMPTPALPMAPDAIALVLTPGARVSVRSRRAGDRFVLGQAGHKRVSDELSDRKLPRVWRRRVPTVWVDGELRWIPGVRVIHPAAAPPPNVVMTLEGPMPWVVR